MAEGVPVSVVWNVGKKVYQLHEVDDKIRPVLSAVENVERQLEHARRLRREKAALLSRSEEERCLDTFDTVADAIAQLQALIEGSRADMSTAKGSSSLKSRLLYVMRDEPQQQLCMSTLQMAHTSLVSVLSMLDSRLPVGNLNRASDSSPLSPAPPPYEEKEWLLRGRQKNLERRSTSTKSRNPRRSSGSTTQDPEPELPSSETKPDSVDDTPSPRLELAEGLLRATSSGSSESGRLAGNRGKTRAKAWLQACMEENNGIQ